MPIRIGTNPSVTTKEYPPLYVILAFGEHNVVDVGVGECGVAWKTIAVPHEELSRYENILKGDGYHTQVVITAQRIG